MSILCDAIRRDVLADEFIRETAFKLHYEDDDDDDEEKDDDVSDKSTNDELQFSSANNSVVSTSPKVIMTNAVVGDVNNDVNKNNTTLERVHP